MFTVSFLSVDSTQRPVFFFTLPGVCHTTTLLLGNNESVLYVGAQDAVLSLDVSQSDVIKLKKKVGVNWCPHGSNFIGIRPTVCVSVCLQVEWRPSETDIGTCHLKGKDPLVMSIFYFVPCTVSVNRRN